MSSVRAFLAVPLPLPLKDAITRLQEQLRRKIANVRWTDPANLHLTLHFFGDIDQETLEKLKVSVLSVRGCQRPFRADVHGLGAFPSLHRPKVIWLGMDQQDRLRQLHQVIQRSLQEIGITPDTRPYAPHLTLGRARGRIADLSGLSVTFSDTTLGQLVVDRLILYESRLHPQGAQHIPLLTVNLDE